MTSRSMGTAHTHAERRIGEGVAAALWVFSAAVLAALAAWIR